ncbi:MAG: DEAD/DEAH box helicase, partial [Acidimicrobiia bacterium]
MSSTFADLGTPPDLVAALTARGIHSPFPVQALTVADGLAGRDVSAKAPTGSGKTIAFGIPMVTRVSRADARRPHGLVLVPTRELAAQVRDELEWLGKPRKLRVTAVYGGIGLDPQRKALRRGIDILVACPGRLKDLLDRGDVNLGAVEMVVLDEADRMTDMGFLPAVRALLDRTPKTRQTLLFSATLDGDVATLLRRYQRDPVRHEVAELVEHRAKTTHLFWAAERGDRVRICADVVSVAGPTIVFCRTKRGTDQVAKKLVGTGVRAVAIHGNRSQGQRERALRAFTDGDVEALVATDVAARGIHIDDVACVVHYDPPPDITDYTHRSGRTARAG